jgi:hypothetical protein
MLSIAIPSRNEKFLKQTILDVLKNATGEIEIFPVLDGYEPPAEEIVVDPRVQYLRIPLGDGKCHKRQGVNLMVSVCKGEYVMSLDAHCMVAKGFDTQLAKDHKPNWVQVPRRHRLDAENWCLQDQHGKPPIDYEYIKFEPLFTFGYGLGGSKWDEKTIRKMEVPIDDILTFQGSCWFMSKDWYNKMGFMQIEGYLGWGQEAEELSFATWKNGGEVKVNKNTWYAHLRKGKKYGRMYHLPPPDLRKCSEYTYDLWMNKNRDFLVSLLEKFMPMPGWPDDWKEQLKKIDNGKKYENTGIHT